MSWHRRDVCALPAGRSRYLPPPPSPSGRPRTRPRSAAPAPETVLRSIIRTAALEARVPLEPRDAFLDG